MASLQLISLVEYAYCSVRSCMTGKAVNYSGGCHGEACAIGGQKQLADGCSGGVCHGGGCDKTLQKAAIAEGRPVHVATGMLPMEPKVPVAPAQPMI